MLLYRRTDSVQTVLKIVVVSIVVNRLRDQIRIFESVELISDWSCTGQTVRHDEKIRAT